MNVDVSTDIVSNRPSEIVAGYGSDPDDVPDWYANIKSVEWQTQRPSHGTEASFYGVVDFGG